MMVLSPWVLEEKAQPFHHVVIHLLVIVTEPFEVVEDELDVLLDWRGVLELLHLGSPKRPAPHTPLGTVFSKCCPPTSLCLEGLGKHMQQGHARSPHPGMG